MYSILHNLPSYSVVCFSTPYCSARTTKNEWGWLWTRPTPTFEIVQLEALNTKYNNTPDWSQMKKKIYSFLCPHLSFYYFFLFFLLYSNIILILFCNSFSPFFIFIFFITMSDYSYYYEPKANYYAARPRYIYGATAIYFVLFLGSISVAFASLCCTSRRKDPARKWVSWLKAALFTFSA